MIGNIKEDALIKIKSIIEEKERELDNIFTELDGIVDIDTIVKCEESIERHLGIWNFILKSVINQKAD